MNPLNYNYYKIYNKFNQNQLVPILALRNSLIFLFPISQFNSSLINLNYGYIIFLETNASFPKLSFNTSGIFIIFILFYPFI